MKADDALAVVERASDTPRRLFAPLAAGYDARAQALCLFQYRRWHRFLLSRLDLTQSAVDSGSVRVLDMASGTGALALDLARLSRVRVVGADVTRTMLLEAQKRLRPATGHIDLVECDAQTLPFARQTFDAIVFAYLLRYVADVPSTLAGLANALRPGGVMASLDFGMPSGLAYPLWRLYTGLVLPAAAALLSPGWRRVGAFLGPSIRDFYRLWPEERLLRAWQEHGFENVQAQRLSLGGGLVMWGRKAR